MTGYYDASAPPPERPDVRDDLAALQRDQSHVDLLAALERVEELSARQAEEEDGPDADVVRLLEEITGADDAPLAFRSLHDRVAAGHATWAEFWAAPQDHADGPRLFAAVIGAQSALNAAVAAAPAPDPQP
ncbi:hypothetical protein [Nocardioides houyundeii]|uniref:hypothetical protein n=1 Tax=Nocardioides houyundeii TaxID=2045452 RepID=UPI000C767772|nr:hypothetical protein [Nocardioides houyundeii]